MQLGSHRPDRSWNTFGNLPDDVLGGPAVVGGLDDLPRHLRVNDHADAGMLLPDARDLRDGKTLVYRAVPFPQQHARVAYLLEGKAAANFVWIPDRHLVER